MVRAKRERRYRPGVLGLEGRALMAASLASREFVIGTDAQVYGRAVDASGQPAGGYFQVAQGQVKDLAVTRLANGGAELFVIGLDNRVYAQTYDASGNHSTYFKVVVTPVSSISAGHDAFGRPLLFFVSPTGTTAGVGVGSIYEQKFDPGGLPVGGYTLAAYGGFVTPMASYDAHIGAPILVGLGSDQQVYVQRMDAVGNPSGTVTGYTGQVNSVAVGNDASGNPLVYVVGTDSRVYSLSNAFSQYTLADPAPVKSVAIGHDASGIPELFAIGMDDQLYGHKLAAAGGPVGTYFKVSQGGVLQAVAGSDAQGRPLVYAAGLDAQVYTLPFDANGSPAGGYTLTSPGNVAKIVLG